MKFEDTDIWHDSLVLAKAVYQLTGKFPESEKFGLVSQVRRASTSVGANFTEGFGRASSKDKTRFYTIAYGSLLETKHFLYLSVELDFCEIEDVSEIMNLIVSMQKRIQGLIKVKKAS